MLASVTGFVAITGIGFETGNDKEYLIFERSKFQFCNLH